MYFLVVFHTLSPIYAYVFFCACRHHSAKSAKWGHLIPFAQLPSLPPPPPGSAAYVTRCEKTQTELHYCNDA